MKKITIFLLCIIIFGCYIYIQSSFIKFFIVKEESKENLNLAYEWVQQTDNNIQNEVYNTQDLISENNLVGILEIPKLNVYAPVKEGTTQEIMKTSVGHFIESDFWNGNVSLASHNGGTNAHFFEKIYLLNNNDEIIYYTKLGIRKYKVSEIKEIASTDWSMVEKNKNSNKNTITLITCINNYPNKRLCVRAEEYF